MVTGASGTVGREVVARLVPLASVRLLTRSPACLAPPAPGVEVVVGDFSDPVRLATAFAGVRAVFVVTADPLRPDHDANIIDVALACGVRHVVKLSALAVADPAADDLITRWQRANEERLLASGLDWTLLKAPGVHVQYARLGAGQIRESGVVRGLGRDGRNSCVDPRDIAQVAVRALTRTGHSATPKAYLRRQGQPDGRADPGGLNNGLVTQASEVGQVGPRPPGTPLDRTGSSPGQLHGGLPRSQGSVHRQSMHARAREWRTSQPRPGHPPEPFANPPAPTLSGTHPTAG
ncbi:hypothetical protein SVIOM74S_06022 [Streptomyces violarus]